jgi:hypothetical protein
MTAAATQRPEPYEVPEGGLGSFLTATVGDWSDEALNADNYYDVIKPTADQLAQFGREEDDRIAHVATGETIIPMAVFEKDPALKEAVFNRMMEMGIDPERYIVGNELNSINPVTGQPEFFLKKIFKGIKKAVKGVVKVFKKVAPIVLSTVGFMVAGPLGASLGSGIGTLIQGGNLKDAFKAAAIAGITAGVTQGIGQGFEAAGQATGGFGAKLSSGLQGFGESISSGLSGGYVDQFAQGFSNLTGQTAAQAAAPKTPMTAPEAVADAFGPVGPGPDGITYAAGPSPYAGDPVAMASRGPFNITPSTEQAATSTAPSGLEEVVVTAKRLPPNTLSPGALAATTAPGFKEAVDQRQELLETGTATYDELGTPEYQTKFERSKLGQARDYLTRGGMSPADIALEQTALENRLADKAFKNAIAAGRSEAAARLAAQAARESAKFAPTLFGSEFLAKYGPSALGITGLAAAAGAFEVPEMEPLEGGYGTTGMDLLAQNPLKYRTYAQAGSGYNPPPVGVAGGGSMDTRSFPRRDGAISGPGTETSDDIPAMLSDGEFVMTARAVRGAGNGSREAGMRKMYNMMSQFERAV